jgi:hypothetical protein
MQNREELRQKGHGMSRKTMCRERGKNINFRRGGEINIVLEQNIDTWIKKSSKKKGSVRQNDK